MIKNFKIQNIRNLSKVALSLGPRFNVFFGENGSGKTSILEAIFYLSRGKSFRTRIAERIIQHEQNSLVLYGEFQYKNYALAAGIERFADGQRRIRLNGQDIQQIVEITQQLPLLFIGTDSYRYFSDGPKQRRQFLDWGLFHVEPLFYPAWQQFSRVLKQRNAALKAHLPYQEIQTWDNVFIELSNTLNEMRENYIAQLTPIFQAILSDFIEQPHYVSRETAQTTLQPEAESPKAALEKKARCVFGDIKISSGIESGTQIDVEAPHQKIGQLRYTRGWSKLKSIKECLDEQQESDMASGYTHSGPQRADLQLYYGKIPAQDLLSQGQQKLAAYALKLAQGQLLKEVMGKAPVYLVDDLPSELDPKKQRRVFNILKDLDAQVLITTINRSDLDPITEDSQTKLFHVEQGLVSEKDFAAADAAA